MFAFTEFNKTVECAYSILYIFHRLLYDTANTHSLSLCFNGHFPGEPGLASAYWSKWWWRWWWQWTTGAISRAKLQPNHHHQQPTSSFYRPDALPVTQPTVSKKLKGKISHSMDLLTPSSPVGLPTLSLTTNSSWLPWGRVAMPLVSPLMPVPLKYSIN